MLAPIARRAAALACLSSLAIHIAPPAAAQDCWTPDSLEPNDVNAVTITPGSYTDLRFHRMAPGVDFDRDRFRITIPPFQRMTADFEPRTNAPSYAAGNGIRIFGTVSDVAGGQKSTGFDTSTLSFNLEHSAVFENDSAAPIVVEIDARVDITGPIGCFEYDMHVSLAPRPCDVLPDDALEGPEDCTTATVLSAGLHSDLVVFNDVRLAGADADYYLIPNVQPGDWFEVWVEADNGLLRPVTLSVSEVGACPAAALPQTVLFQANTTGLPQDYAIVVETTADQGYANYDLNLIYRPTSTLTPDAFEPSQPCGQFVPITEGRHAATLTFGDSDAYWIAVPPESRLSVDVSAESGWVDFHVAVDESTCPPIGSSRSDSYFNDSQQIRVGHIRVDSVGGLSGNYEISVGITPLACSNTDILRNEPDDDCSNATPVTLEPAFNSSSTSALETITLDGTDTDTVRFEVPARSALVAELKRRGFQHDSVDRPAVMLRAYADGDCSNSPLLGQVRATDTLFPLQTAARMLLTNRSDTPATYALQMSRLTASATHPCEQYDLWLLATPLGEYTVLPGIVNSSCETAEQVGPDVLSFEGLVSTGRPTFGITEVRSGETLTVSVSAGAAYAPLRFALHDGLGDCAVDGASFGSITDPYLPLVASAPMLEISHTNTTADSQRVVIECGFADGYCAPQTRLHLRLDRSPEPVYRSGCDSTAPGDYFLPCPCDNHDSRAAGTGCSNSTGLGARLTASGTTSVQADALFLEAGDLPAGAIGVVYTEAGLATGESTFYDGTFCLSAYASRTPFLVTADNAGRWTASMPTASNVDTAAGSSSFQLWYRDNAGPCGSGGNTSNVIVVEWTP